MFDQEFFPTPDNVIEMMLQDVTIENKTFLEPSAGKGDIIDFLNLHNPKSVLSCEKNEDLRKILQSKSKVIGNDFLEVESHQISHIDYIVMNPPFSSADKHILHAFNIAPKGCKIIALCNSETINNAGTQTRKELKSIIEAVKGNITDLGQCFEVAERKTGVSVSMIRIQKPGESYNTEFEGFFLEDEPEEAQGYGILKHDNVRELVNRYVAAVKLFDEKYMIDQKMNALTCVFHHNENYKEPSEHEINQTRTEFKKELQKDAWKYIFNLLKMEKYTTRGLREDINKFVEQQTNIPFTMRNIYKMLEIVIGTQEQRMNKAIIEVFDRVTERHHDNRYNVKGWKTNSHFLVGKKFILPNMISEAKQYGYTSETYSYLTSSYDGIIPDFEKALCFITGENYSAITNTVNHSINRNSYGEWYTSHFFKYKGYKNGNMHFEFKDEKVWELFNKKVAEIKGYVLFEAKEQTDYQKRNTGRRTTKTAKTKAQSAGQQAKVLFTFKTAE
ncbi:MAG: DUF4942 domain-containing protein [Chitinophagales bacterium]